MLQSTPAPLHLFLKPPRRARVANLCTKESIGHARQLRGEQLDQGCYAVANVRF